MGPLRGAPPAVALFRFPPLELLVLLLLLQMHVQTPCGFLAPASPRTPARATDVARRSVNRRPPAPPRPATEAGTAAAAEVGATIGAAANGAGTRTGPDDDLPGARAEESGAAGAGAGRASSSVLSEFQEFVERRKSGARRVFLDLRPAEDFRREHLEGSTSIPIDELEPRLLELPPPFAQPVSIVGNQQGRRLAREFLTKKGWQIDAEIGLDLVVGTEDAAEAWPTEAGRNSVQAWRANDFLEFCTERFLLPSSWSSPSTDDASTTDAANDRGVALDLGCGSGRDTVYMAQHLPPGTRVVGIDNHSYALERGARLAHQWLEDSSLSEGGADGGGEGGSNKGKGEARTRREVESESEEEIRGGAVRAAERSGGENRGGSRATSRGTPPDARRRRACEWLLADLRKEGSLDGLQAYVVHGHRFKCEQLLPLLRDDVLLPGGFFIWSTFLDTGTENLVPPWRPSRMMRPGELAGIFSGDGFEILVDEQGKLPTRGSVVPANFFACRKKVLVE